MSGQHLILIVDDSAVGRMQLRRILEPEYAVVEAADGRQALARLAELRTDVAAVFLDLMMPELDGFGVLEAMSQNEEMRNLAVIVLTASDRPDDELRALDLGAMEFLPKPYRPEVVRRRLDNVIRLQESAASISSAEHDSLTGLYNKDAFYRHLRRQFLQQPEQAYIMAAVDIERFKLINDLFSVAEGDRLLRHVARQLQGFARGADFICCRLDGGHFAFLCTNEQALLAGIVKILSEIQHYSLGVQVLLRFGIFHIDNLELEISTMCDRAMLAAETIKGRYDSYYAYYDDSIRNRLLQEQQIESDMRPALLRKEFEVYYQPKVDLFTERIVGAEALVRWQHPHRGLLQPSEFISLFEHNGFITELDLYICDRVCMDIAKLRLDQIPFGPISINLSRLDVYDPALTEKLLRTVHAYDLEPQMLDLEITETAYTQNPRQLVEVVEQLKHAGFRIEMDDFGSGYSSLNMLSELPIDTLKLDMRFMQSKMADKSNDILNFVISLARWLGLVVIAEGVETEQQAQFLRSLNCNIAQGYYFSPPVTETKLRQLLLNNEGRKTTVSQGYSGVVELSELWSPTSAFNNIFSSFIGILAIYEYDGTTLNFIRANEKFYEASGSNYVRANEGGGDIMGRIQEEDRAALRDKLNAAWSDGTEFTLNVRWYLSCSAALPHWLHMRFKLINRSEHRAIFISSQEDVTKDKLLEDRLIEAARRDSMTGLLNRVAFESAVERELEEVRGAVSGAFIMLDLDNFKHVNDTGGHQHGDDVLRQVSQILKEAIRDEDLMARFGGDEFAVYLRNIPSRRVARDRAQHICDSVNQFGRTNGISCSAGIALYPNHGAKFRALYQKADEALYQAKRSGKNQFIIAESEERTENAEILAGCLPDSAP